MEKLEYTVRQTICRYHMLQPGDQVVIALSGGADSVCLLSLLADMREEMGLKLRSLHVHHGLRGEEADRDGDFSIKIVICQQMSIDIYRQSVYCIACNRKTEE